MEAEVEREFSVRKSRGEVVEVEEETVEVDDVEMRDMKHYCYFGD